MKKRICLALLLTAIAFCTTKADEITFNSVTLEPGEQAELVINASLTNANLTSYQFDIYLPEGISVAYDDDEEDYVYALSGRHKKDHTLSLQEHSDYGFWRFIVSSNSNKLIRSGEGELLTLTLQASATASGTHTVQVKNIKMAEPDQTSHVLNNTSFGLTVNSVVVNATSVSLDRTTLSLTSAEQTTRLIATVLPTNATNKTVTWTSSNTAVATVDASGLVTAKSNGTATITATTTDGSNKSATCEVTVNIPVATDEFTFNSVTIDSGDQAELVINATLSNANITSYQFDIYLPEGISVAYVDDEEDYVYALSGRHKKDHTLSLQEHSDYGFWRFIVSSNSNKLIRSGEGELLTLTLQASPTASGTHTVQVKNIKMAEPDQTSHVLNNTSFNLTVNTVVVNATSVSLDKTTLSFSSINQTTQLTATVLPTNATNKSVTWTSSNTAVATVDASGLVTAKSNGTATITATTTDGSNKSATCSVTVSAPILVTGVSLSQTSLTFSTLNTTQTLTATVTPSNAANKTLTWTSSNTSVATVDANGLVTAKATGTATITATAADGSGKKATCTVTVNIEVSEFVVNGIKYSLTGNKTVKVAKDSYSGDIVIPSSVAYGGMTYSVTAIGDYVFNGCSGLTSVTIPNSVTTIGTSAFQGCTSLEGLYISDLAAYCDIDIPASSTTASPIYYAKNLYLNGQLVVNLIVPEGVTKLGNHIFDGCTSIKDVTLPEGLTTIGQGALAIPNMEEVTLPSTVIDIGHFALRSNCLSKIVAKMEDPSAITMGSSCFIDEAYSEVTLYVPPTAINAYKSTKPWSNFSNITPISNNAVEYISEGRYVIVSAGKGPGYYTGANPGDQYDDENKFALYNKDGLVKWKTYDETDDSFVYQITSDEKGGWYIRNIKDDSFINRAKSDNGSSTGSSGYYNSEVTTSATKETPQLIEATNQIGKWTIRYKDNRYVYSLKAGHDGATEDTSGNISIWGTSEEAQKYRMNVWYLYKITDVAIDVSSIILDMTTLSLTSVGQTVQLTATVLPSNATNKSVNWTSSNTAVAMVDANGLVTAKSNGTATITATTADTNIKATCTVNVTGNYIIQDGIKYEINSDNISVSVVANSYNGEIVIPSEITYLGTSYVVTGIAENAFKDCTELTSITIPNSVTSIGVYAFRNCARLTSLSIPNSVTNIENAAFENCSSLSSIAIPSSVTSIGEWLFAGCTSLTRVEIPNSVTSIGVCAFRKCSNLVSLEIPSSLTNISNYAFLYCSSLSNVTIPSSVTSIGNRAFQGCSSLGSLWIYTSNVNSLGDNIFYSADNVRKVIICSTDLQEINNTFFSSSTYENAVLYVPNAEVKAQCQVADYWKNFTNIEVFSDGLQTMYDNYYAEEFVVDHNPGYYEESAVNAYNAAMQQAHDLLEDGGTSEDYLNALKKLETAHSALADAIIPITEGYYYIVSGFDDFLNNFGHEKAVWDNTGENRIFYKNFDPDNIQFVWHITPNTDSDAEANEYWVQNYLTGNYVAKGTAWYNSETALTHGPAEPQNIRFYTTGKWYWGSRTYHNTSYAPYASSNPVAKDGANILTSWGQWDDESTVNTHFNLWYLRKVSDEQMAEFVEEKAHIIRTDKLDSLIVESNKLYESLYYGLGEGLITNANDDDSGCQIWSNAQDPNKSTYSALIDNTISTIFHSTWHPAVNEPYTKPHNLQFDFSSTPTSCFVVRMLQRCTGWGPYDRPTIVSFYASNADDLTTEEAWTFIQQINIADIWDKKAINYYSWGTTPAINLGNDYKYVRMDVIATGGNRKNEGAQYPYFSLTELQVYPANSDETTSPYRTIGGMSELADRMKALAAAKKDIVSTGTATVEDIAELQAVMDSVRTVHTITYMVDDNVYKEDTYVLGARITVPEVPIRDGYSFDGWDEVPATMPANDVVGTGTFYLYGDVNTDTKVNVVDVVDIARYVVETPSERFREKLADLNKDKTVSIADAVVLVNVIAGNQNFVEAEMPTTSIYDYEQGQLKLLSYETNVLSLCLNGDDEFTAFQFEVEVPDNTDISTLCINGLRNNGHQLLYNKVSDNRYRVAALSLSNSVFKGKEGELLRISVDGIGTDDIYIHNIHFVKSNGTDVTFNDLNVDGSETGVISVSGDIKETIIYDLQGRRHDTLQHGINIVGGKKIYVP